MKQFIAGLVIVSAIGGGLLVGGVPVARAMTPTLSLYATGNGDAVQVTVNGDAYASVLLYYQKSGYGWLTQSIGTTNSNGYISTTISTSSYGIVSGSSVRVTVNNQQSLDVVWPYSTTSGGALSLSQSNVSVTVGQSSSTITVSGGTMPYTLFPNSSTIFQSAIGGNTLIVTGLVAGSSSLNVCNAGGAGSGCTMMYITVSGSTSTYAISLSQTSISLATGGSTNVTIYGNGGYYISTHTNPNIASAYISGSTLVVSGINYGSDTVSVCQTGGQCATLYVNVAYDITRPTTANAVTFSQQNPALSVGQSMSITMYGGTSGAGYNYYPYANPNYYVAYNSNTSAITTSISGSTLTLRGVSAAAAGIVICSSTNSCGAISATVGLGDTQGTWTSCANENKWCSFSGTKLVRYGANGVYFYKTATGGISCTNAVFGDPIFGVVKKCSYSTPLYY